MSKLDLLKFLEQYYLIFDADHTLIDFEADEREAFRKIFALCGRRADEDMLARCRELSVRTWDDVGLSDVDDAVIQRTYHELYRSHLPLLFSRIFREFPTEMSPERAAEIFLRLVEEGGAPEKGAEKVLSVLSEATGGKYRICVATNGVYLRRHRRHQTPVCLLCPDFIRSAHDEG